MKLAMEFALSEVGEDVRKRVLSTAAVEVSAPIVNAGTGVDGTRKRANTFTVAESRGNANQWADKEKNWIQFGYDADAEAEKWWAEYGQKTIAPLARM